MKIYKRLIFIMLFLLCLQAAAAAQLLDNGFYPYNLKGSSRHTSMGSAFVAMADDMGAIIYNPGGLPWASGMLVNYESLDNLLAIQAYPTGFGSTWGFAYEKTTDTSNNTGTAAQLNSNYLLFGFGTKLSGFPELSKDPLYDNIGVGLTIKSVLSQSLNAGSGSDISSTGWEADIGALWKCTNWFALGLVSKNICPDEFLNGGRFKWSNGSTESIASGFEFGASLKLIGDIHSPIYVEDNELFVNLDMVSNKYAANFPFLLRAGTEWGVRGKTFIRTGVAQTPYYQNNSWDARWVMSYGMGVRAEGWGLDFNFTGGPQAKSMLSFLYFPKEWVFEREPKRLTSYRTKFSPVAEPIKLYWDPSDLTTYDENTFISGEAVPGAEIFVNGNTVQVANGKFNVYVPLQPGKNLVALEGRYNGEKIISINRKVLRKAKVVVAEEKSLTPERINALKTSQKEQEVELKKVDSALAKARTQAETKRLSSKKEAIKKEIQQTTAQVKEVELQQKTVQDRKEKLETLVTMGVIEVAPDKDFELQSRVTRAELCVWIVRAAKLPLPRVEKQLFKDVPADSPSAPYIKIVADAGLMRPYTDGTFRPNQPVTKKEGEEIFKRIGLIQ